MLLAWLAARTSLLAGMQIRQSLDPCARHSLSSWTVQRGRPVGPALKGGLRRGPRSAAGAASSPSAPQQQPQQQQQKQAPPSGPHAQPNAKDATSGSGVTPKGSSGSPPASTNPKMQPWHRAPQGGRGSAGHWDKHPGLSIAVSQVQPAVPAVTPSTFIAPQQPPQQQQAQQQQQQQPLKEAPWQQAASMEAESEPEVEPVLPAADPVSSPRPQLPPELAGCDMEEDYGMGYRRPGSDTPTTVWVVTPPLDKFTKWMHSIGGSVEPLPGMQPFSHIAHIEHSQLQSSLGPNPGYCVEAPPGCDVHITGPSSLEDCGCLIYFVSNFEYQRTSKEECDTAGKAHYELYTAAGGGQVTESAGKTQRRLDRPGNLGMAMFGWRKNHSNGRLGLYQHSSAEDPATLDTTARKMAMREFRSMMPLLEVTGSLAVMEEAQSKSDGPCINIPGTFISTKSITLNYNIEPHLDDDNAPGELSSIRWWDYCSTPVVAGRFLLSPYLCTRPTNGSILLLQPAVMWHGGQQVLSPTNVEAGEGRYGTALFRKPEVQQLLESKFRTQPWRKGSAAIDVGDEPMEEGLPKNGQQWRHQMLSVQGAWGSVGGRIELPPGTLLPQ